GGRVGSPVAFPRDPMGGGNPPDHKADTRLPRSAVTARSNFPTMYIADPNHTRYATIAHATREYDGSVTPLPLRDRPDRRPPRVPDRGCYQRHASHPRQRS